MAQCLKAHEADLSATCKAARAEMQQKWQAKREEMVAACKDDAAKFCADVKPGHGAIAQCLQAHRDQLSDSCKGALPHRSGEVK